MEFSENKPIYLQLADQLMDEAESSPDTGGRRLPSVREFAARTGVNANTVMRSYTWLQQEGIIYNQRGIGYFYCEDAYRKILDMRKKVFLSKEFPYFLDRLATFGMSPEELNRTYKNYLGSLE